MRTPADRNNIRVGQRVIYMGKANTVGTVTATNEPRNNIAWVKRDGWRVSSSFLTRDLTIVEDADNG